MFVAGATTLKETATIIYLIAVIKMKMYIDHYDYFRLIHLTLGIFWLKQELIIQKQQVQLICLKKVYNGKGTVNKAVSAEFLRMKIFESLNKLQAHVATWYSYESLPNEKEIAVEKMKLLIQPEAPYSAFMRDVLFEDEKLRFLVENLDL